MDYDPSYRTNWVLAPDGLRLAWIKWDPAEAHIHVLSLSGGADGLIQARGEREVTVEGASHFHTLTWSADGKGWYVTTQLPASWALLYVDPQGRSTVLLTLSNPFSPDVFLSPDGHHIAFTEENLSSNLWLLKSR